MTTRRYRIYAPLLAFGASVLLGRTIIMVSEGSFHVFVWWVALLLLAEPVLDVTTLLASLRWWTTGGVAHERFSLRAGAAAALLHAFRVLIFVLGRTGPWVDFDVRPEQRALHAARWTWGQVYFASILSLLGVVGVILIWRYRRRHSGKGA